MPDPSLITPLGQQMLDSLPTRVRGSIDYMAVVHAIAREVDLLESSIEQVRTEFNPATANLLLSAWEAMLKLPDSRLLVENVIPDPNLEYDAVSGSMPPLWAPIDNGTTRAASGVSETWATGGTKSLESFSNYVAAASGSNSGINVPIANLAATFPGQVWSARADVNVIGLPTPSIGLQLGIRFYDNTTTFISHVLSDPADTLGEATLSISGAVAPAGAAFVQLTVRSYVTGTGSGFLFFYADRLLLAPLNTIDPEFYFDGDIPGARWLGPAGASASQNTAVRAPDQLAADQAKVIARLQKILTTGAGSAWEAAITEIVGFGWSYVEDSPSNGEITITLPFASGTTQFVDAQNQIRDITDAHLELSFVSTSAFQLDISEMDVQEFGF